QIGGVRAAVHVDHAPGVRACDVQDENLFELGRVDELEAGRVKERGPGRGFAVDERRIARESRLAVIVYSFGPRLEGNRPRRAESACAGSRFPITFRARGGAEVRVAVWVARGRVRSLLLGQQGRGRNKYKDRLHRVGSFVPFSRSRNVVGIAPAQLFFGSFASAAPSSVILSPIFTLSFFQPPRTSAYGGPSSKRTSFVAPASSFVVKKMYACGLTQSTLVT